jgi:DNA-binding NarL/FixJ family response regulator
MTYNPKQEHEERVEPARVYVWSEDRLAVDGLEQALASQPRVVCVATPAEAEILLWDVGSTGLDAPAVLAQLSAAQSCAQHIVAMVLDVESAARCLQLGARSALLRRIHAPSLAAAILAARAGLCVFDAELADSWVHASPASDTTPATSSALTAREHEVLQLLALGLSNRHIAKRLAVSIHTVKFHVNSILAKLNVDSRTAAVSAGLRGGLISL